ncbi:MAG: hypothetical protein RLZZ299_1500 [Pseudomonadota bacterium]
MTGITLHRGARIEALAARLVDQLRMHPPQDPISPVTISVGSRGMERWLRNHLATALPISANVAFPFPGEALAHIYGGEADALDPWRPDTLAWHIAALLPALIDRPAFGPLRTWLLHARPDAEAHAAGRVTRDVWSLAREVADVLDRAALFRPDWVRAWEAGGTVAEAPAWQADLWHALHVAIGTDHPTRRYEATPHPGDALHVFAVTSLPPVWLQALARAGTRREVHVYLLTPSQEYWGDTRSRRQMTRLDASQARQALEDQNPLLTAFGVLARDTAEAYLALPDVLEPDVDGAFDVSGAHGALGILQSDVIHARSRADIRTMRAGRALVADDDSLQFHACHGPTRQVEALRETLIDLFERHRDLQPRDVVVMTPDLGTYAPLLHTVLPEGHDTRGPDGWGPAGAPRIPTHVADLGVRALNPLADVLLRALDLIDRPLAASTLADFLALEPVRRRFGLEDAALARVRTWLREAGARHGADAADRARQGLPPQHAFTLAFALDRLALGVTHEDDGSAGFHGIAPFDEMEGDAAGTFGILAEACARLEGWRTRLRVPRTVTDWTTSLAGLVDELADVPTAAALLRSELLDGLGALAREASAFPGQVDTGAMIAILQSRFERSVGGDRPTTGAVTVCALAPMRSVPFRVVCLVGMDDGTFPRPHHPRAFDATASNPRPGDRDPREEDRNLLLEAILAARSHLLVFYTGRDPRTDRTLPPAVPIGDLLDVVDLTFEVPSDPAIAPRQLMTRIHAVQPFASSGFRRADPWPSSPRPVRYDARMHLAACALARGRHGFPPFAAMGETLPEGPRPLGFTLDALVRWVRRPVRTLVRERLGLHLQDGEQELRDREPLDLDGLERWAAGDAMATAWLEGARDREPVIERLHGRGMLPPGAPGRAIGTTLWQHTASAGEVLDALFGGRLPHGVQRDVHVALPVEDGPLTVTGSVESFGDALIRFSHDAPNRSRALLTSWIQLLGVRAAGHDVTCVHIVGSTVRGELPAGEVITLEVPTVDEARAHLADLVALALEAHRAPIALVDKTTFAWASRALLPDLDTLSEDARHDALAAARQAARREWHSNAGAAAGESADPALTLVFGDSPPFGHDPHRFAQDFERLAARLWRPLLAARRAT